MKTLNDFEPLRDSTRSDRNISLVTHFLLTLVSSGQINLSKMEALGLVIEVRDHRVVLSSLLAFHLLIFSSFMVNLKIDSTFWLEHQKEWKSAFKGDGLKAYLVGYFIAHWVSLGLGMLYLIKVMWNLYRSGKF